MVVISYLGRFAYFLYIIRYWGRKIQPCFLFSPFMEMSGPDIELDYLDL